MSGGAHTPFGVTLRRLADADPDRPALTCGEVTLTRAEFVARVGRVARRLRDLGVEEGRLVTIGVPNSVEFVEAMFAIWVVGGIPQPISHHLTPAERTAIIELADPALVIGVPADESGGRPTLSAGDLHAASTGGDIGHIEPRIAPVWKVMPTGGSTGRPKLIVATQPAVTEAATALGDLVRLPENGAVLVTAPMAHNAPFVTVTASLLLGNHVVVMPRFDALETLRLVEAHAIQWLYLVPTMMLRIWRLSDEERLHFDLSSLEVAFHMAAARRG